MLKKSLLYKFEQPKQIEKTSDFLKDLNIDQIISSILSSKKDYDLMEFYLSPLHNELDIKYRHEIFKDLDERNFLNSVIDFCNGIHKVKEVLNNISKLYYEKTKERFLLEAIQIYCNTIDKLYNYFLNTNLKSEGLMEFFNYLSSYVNSSDYTILHKNVVEITSSLDTVKYTLHIKYNNVKVTKYNGEADYSEEIKSFFQKFQQGNVPVYQFKYRNRDMNHIEAAIIDRVAKLYPDIFERLHNFAIQNQNFIAPEISKFEQEIQFYISYLEYIQPLRKEGLKFCYPDVSEKEKNIYCEDAFDIALAHKLIYSNEKIVCNSLSLNGEERIIILTGPNQGGKTTFARMYGQLHYFASLGLPIPGSSAKLFLPDNIFTHFERQENQINLHGKLQDDIVRINQILNQATSKSLLIINEMFSSTSLQDAIWLGKQIIEQISNLDILCIYVTFLEELSVFNNKTVSMISTVGQDKQTRTYRIIRHQADGKAYAKTIAQKYHLTYEDILRRLET